jgi:hypothetical protein
MAKTTMEIDPVLSYALDISNLVIGAIYICIKNQIENI